MNLEQRKISDIEGDFLIEAYQRGYRWGYDEISHLLNDIDEIPSGQPYCLQPVVVKRKGNKWELIDGQQRLTTLYLVIQYLENYIDRKYSIEYTTRKGENGKLGSKELLENIKSLYNEPNASNIDELFIKNAYRIISNR